MRSLIQKCLLGALLATAVVACAPTPVKADADDRYWRHYWRWYDSTYRPYYHRRYYHAAPPVYNYPPAPVLLYGGSTYYSHPAPMYPYSNGGIVIGPTIRYGWW
jgi:hypothetical protein